MIPVVPQNLFRGADGSETNDPGDSVGRRNRWKNSNGGIGRHAQAECWRCVFFSTVSAHKKRVARFLQHPWNKCRCRSLGREALVPVMKSSDLRKRNYLSAAGRMDGPSVGRILPERQVRAPPTLWSGAP